MRWVDAKAIEAFFCTTYHSARLRIDVAHHGDRGGDGVPSVYSLPVRDRRI